MNTGTDILDSAGAIAINRNADTLDIPKNIGWCKSLH